VRALEHRWDVGRCSDPDGGSAVAALLEWLQLGLALSIGVSIGITVMHWLMNR
jgi:hypothetical protein